MKRSQPPLEKLCQTFTRTNPASVSDIMHFSLGIEQQWLGPEITPLVPEMRAAGPAFTIRWIDDPDVNASADTTLLGNMIDSLQPLSVPILATSKNRKVGYWGEMMCTVCLSHGINSTVRVP